MLIVGAPVELGSDHPKLTFGEEPKAAGSWAGRRSLQIDGTPAFELSYWCGTCQFLFRRLPGASKTMSIADLAALLHDGLSDLDEQVLARFGDLLPLGTYLPMLVELSPVLQRPGGEGDYFAQEQLRTWGLESFWGLPVYPATPYYRCFETPVSDDAHLFEFAVPMVPPTWNSRAAVVAYEHDLTTAARPTAVAVSTLDICEPADDDGTDLYAHWGLTHFLLDGHHKFEAAANRGLALQLLSLLSVDASLAQPADVVRVPALRSQPRAQRNQKPSG